MTDHTPWWELPGAPGENRTKEQYVREIAALKEPVPDRDRSDADKQDIWDAWAIVDAHGTGTLLDSTDGHAAVVHAIRYGRYGAKPTRKGFERLLASLKYDGADIDSLTVGEIRRALP